MSATPINQNLIQVNRFRFVNAFLVSEEDGFAVVDHVSSHLYRRMPLAAMATWDKGQDLESAKTIRSLEPPMLEVGHGGPVRMSAAELDKAIARAGG